MNAQQDKAKSVFLNAVEIASTAERSAYLEAECGGDEALRREVDELLGHHREMGSFLDSAPAGSATIDFPSTAEVPGTVIGPYKLLEQIGEGGFGVVFMAEQTRPVQRKVALKIIKPGMDSRQVIARFGAERQALALMDHPNIAKVFDGGMTGECSGSRQTSGPAGTLASSATGRPFFVMELVKGVPITEYCDRNHLTPRQRLELFVPVCQAVQHAHQKGIIHRDLKPSNVMVALYDSRPVPKIIDFGVAKATGLKLTEATLFTALGQVVGTFEYMSPEQAELNQLDIDTRSDIYSLGVLLYELLTGTTPLQRKQIKEAAVLEVLRRIREEEPPKPSTRLSTTEELPSIAANRGLEPKKLSGLVRGELDWIVMKCLEKDRNRRYETANGLAMDVQRYLADEPVLACPPSAGYRLRKFARRNKGPVVAASLVLLALIGGIIGTTWQAVRASLAEKEAHVAESQAKGDRQRALQSKKEATDSLVRLHGANGMRQAEEGDLFAAYVAFFEASRLDSDASRADLHRTRLATTLRQCPRLAQCWYHEREVWCIDFSPDGGRVLTGSFDGTARVWDVNTGKPITGLLSHDNAVEFGCFSPDGRRVVTACGDSASSWHRPSFAKKRGEARVWDSTTGQPICSPLKHDDSVVWVRFSPDSRWVVTASFDGTARVWNAESGQPRTPPLVHSGMVHCAQFSHDGQSVVTTSSDKTARIWDALTGQPITASLPHNELVLCAAFSPDDRRVATGCGDGTARVWDATSGAPVTAPLKTGAGHLNQVVFSPDGTRVATGSGDNFAYAWDAVTGQELVRILGHRSYVMGAAFSPNGRYLATASADSTARVWDATTGQPATPLLIHDGPVNYNTLFSPDGRYLITSSDDHTARMWDLAASPAERVLKHASPLTQAEFSPDGHRVLTASHDCTAQIWDVATGQPLTPALQHSGPVTYATFSHDGATVITTSQDGTAKLWNARTGKLMLSLKHDAAVLRAGFSRDDRRVATASADNTARVWETGTGVAVSPPLRHQEDVHDVSFSPDGRTVITASLDATSRIWHAVTGEPITPPMMHYYAVWSASFSPDGKLVLTGDETKARLWEATTGQAVGDPMQHKWAVMAANFSPNGQRVVTASDDGTARLWDAKTGRPLTTPLQHKRAVNGTTFSPDGTRLVTACQDGAARVWDVATAEAVTPPLRHGGPVKSASFSPDGRRLITASQDGTARIWNLEPDPRPMEEWLQFAQLFSRERSEALDSGGADLKAWHKAWQDLRQRFPDKFTATAAEVAAWRQREPPPVVVGQTRPND